MKLSSELIDVLIIPILYKNPFPFLGVSPLRAICPDSIYFRKNQPKKLYSAILITFVTFDGVKVKFDLRGVI